MRTRLIALALVMCLPAVAAAQNREHLQMTADLRILEEKLNRAQLASNQLTDQLKALAKRIDDQASVSQKQAADIQLLINNLSTTVNTVREKLDDNTVRVSQLTQELPAMRSGLSMLAEQLNTLVGLLQPPMNPTNPDSSSGSGATTPGGGLAAVRIPESPTYIFDNAKADYISNRLDSAIDGFREYLEKYPTANNASEAQFWIGQSYYQKGLFKDALTAYGKLISTYKGAPEVPDAYYQQGLCYLDLGQRAEARKTFELIVKQFPNSTQALLAAQKLAAPTPAR